MSGPTGLSISNVVNVTVNLAPLASPRRNFGAMLVLGSSDVIDTNERLREYTTSTDVATDFGSTAPETLAAQLHFSQVPRPNLLYVGRWAQAATHGRLNGATLSAAQQLMSNFTSITTGGIDLTIDGTPHNLASIDLHLATNLNGVASAITTALSGSGTCVWDATTQRFEVKSSTTGAASTVAYATTGAGTDLAAPMGLSQAAGASVPVAGIVAETLVQAVTTLVDMSRAWYGMSVAALSAPSNSDVLAAAQFIESASPSRIAAWTTQEPGVLVAATTTDLASTLKANTLMRSLVQYSSASPYAASSILGRMSTIDFTGSNTTITLKFKVEPGLANEKLTQTQANALEAKSCNVFVLFEDGTAILEQGVMSNGYYIDEVHGTDWLADAVQTDCWNALRQAPKIPQTDAGTAQLVNVIEHVLAQSVNNGLVAPGVWNAPGFGQLVTGELLPSGFYVYAPPVATQAQSDREARKSVPIQVAIKLAGAIHSTNVTINVNR